MRAIRQIVACVTLIGAAFALGAQTASAAPGDLTFTGCVASAGAGGCVDPPQDALGNAAAIALSPDGANAYVTAGTSDAVVTFLSTPSGGLTYGGCTANSGLGGCLDPALDSLSGIAFTAVSPDGGDVYTAALADDSVTQFDRGADGALTQGMCIADGGQSGCVNPLVDSLHTVNDVAVSPDGRDLYAVSLFDDSVTQLARGANGGLSFVGCIADLGRSGCVDPPTDSLKNVFAVAVSPDGKSVYTLGPLLTHFRRDPNGVLEFKGCFAGAARAGCATLPSLAGAGLDIAVSSDGSSVYFVGGGGVTHMARAADGALTFGSCVADGGANGCSDPPLDSLGTATGVAVSPDGASVYAASSAGDAITELDRNASGALSFSSCIANAGAAGCLDPQLDSLDGASALSVSPDGTSLFVVSNGSESVTGFAREPVPPAPPPPAAGDTTAPETKITRAPKRKVKTKRKKRKAKFSFNANEQGSTFECSVDGAPFLACTSPFSKKVKVGKHTFSVRATDAAGNVDLTPATTKWRLKRDLER